MKRQFYRRSILFLVLLASAAGAARGQEFVREFDLAAGGTVEIINHSGKVDVIAEAAADTEGSEKPAGSKASISARSDRAVLESDLKIKAAGGKISVEVEPEGAKRIDLIVKVPARSRVKVETLEGEILVSGDLELVEARTETGTIGTDVPTDAIKYEFQWTASRPRVVSDIELEPVKEGSGGRFSIKGNYTDKDKEEDEPAEEKEEKKDKRRRGISLKFSTARGIVLVNVPRNEVASDLRDRPLTNAAKAIVRSGDSLLMEAIRRASPKHFGDYASSLPPMKREPTFGERSEGNGYQPSGVMRVTVNVTDINNRAIGGLTASDFEITENSRPLEVLNARPVSAPVNLVLLVDVSGSVENYVNFIRKAARNFVETARSGDRISIVLFNDDVKVLSRFTTDKRLLSESLDTFDAGGSTAYYDALAYTLAETLRPLKGERTAIVVLTDGDDNRSFLAFDSLLGSIQESGALIYPLYVPSALIAASATTDPNATVDPLRTRYMGLTTKADSEGARLAEVSGGVYYPITRISQIQSAYEDIVVQLRTAYDVTFRSAEQSSGGRASPRLKVRVRKENAFVKLGPVASVIDR